MDFPEIKGGPEDILSWSNFEKNLKIYIIAPEGKRTITTSMTPAVSPRTEGDRHAFLERDRKATQLDGRRLCDCYKQLHR